MSERKPTYEHFALKTIMPAQGWHAVHYDDAGAHFLVPVYALALAYRRTYDATTHELIPEPHVHQEDEDWEVVGLSYYTCEPWGVCDESRNYCGLLPPDMTLADFEAATHDTYCRSHMGPSAALPTTETGP